MSEEAPASQTATVPECPAPPPPAPAIMPTVGRVVLFFPPLSIRKGDTSLREYKGQPYPAIITHVFGPECVNVAVLPDGSFGEVGTYTSVPIVLDGAPLPEGPCCQWMPYQLGQAKKTEAMGGDLSEHVKRLTAAVRHMSAHNTDRTVDQILAGN